MLLWWLVHAPPIIAVPAEEEGEEVEEEEEVEDDIDGLLESVINLDAPQRANSFFFSTPERKKSTDKFSLKALYKRYEIL